MGDGSTLARSRTVLIANPSADVYGSDLQMLESVSALVGAGMRVVVAIPTGGELVAKLRDRGAEVEFVEFPVLRRADASARGVAALAIAGLRSVLSLRAYVRRLRPDAVYVNTVTLPWWLIAAWLARTGRVCHVHEAETTDGRLVRFVLNAPLLFSSRLIVISKAAVDATRGAVPGLKRRIRLVYNGVAEPPVEPVPNPMVAPPYRVAVVARLSPRKGPDVALDAVGILRERGYDVRLEIAGTPFSGYEWFEQQLRDRADQPDLAGSVTFSGYVSPIWTALERTQIVAAPSLREPFGNAVVEAQLSLRPVVASAALGHLETVTDGVTGLLVPAADATAMADAIERLIGDPELASTLAATSREAAIRRFGIPRYRAEIVGVVESVMRRKKA